MPFYKHTVAAIIPAYNEALSIGSVVSELRALKSPEDPTQPMIDDLIVCNNGSTDDTALLAQRAGANVFDEFRQGYGFACLRGIEKLCRPGRFAPDYVVFIDGDHSVAADEVGALLQALVDGNDLVVGKRVSRLQEREALSPHQRFGNALASNLIRLIWRQPVTDLGPFRAIRFNELLQLNMQDERFGWTVEMQVKAIQAGLRYTEVPVSTLQRIGVSKISGTVRGTIGAALGIFGKVFQLYWQESKFKTSIKQRASLPK